MIVLHAGWVCGELRLWGETEPVTKRLHHPVLVRDSARKGRSRPGRYGAGSGELSRALLESPVPVVIEMRDVKPTMAWLPTSSGHVIPSSPLVGAAAVRIRASAVALRAGLGFAPWIVNAAPLAIDDAIVLLCACMDRRTLIPGVVLGADLIWWSEALRFSGALVARQKYLPGIAIDAEGVQRALWEPVLDPEDLERMAGLARRMPEVARALAAIPETRTKHSRRVLSGPPSSPAAEVLKDACGRFVDHIVRSAASDAIHLSRAARAGEFDSMHDAWLHALGSQSGALLVNPSDGIRMAGQVAEWRRPVFVSVAATARLCFRLEEPPAENPSGSWFVRFLLQSREDPSLIVPVPDAWSAQGRTSSILGGDGHRVRETILSALGQAAGIDPRIASSLESASIPPGYALDATGAYDFLSIRASILQEAGFGVMFPAWWTGLGTQSRLALRARVRAPKMQVPGRISLDEILHFDWEVALGDLTLSLSELEELAALKAPLILVRGQWVELNSEEIDHAIAVWKRKGGDRATARDAIEMALGAKRPPAGFDLERVEASGWIADLIDRLQGHVPYEELEAPEWFHGTLRPYQVRGFSWLAFLREWGLGGCLADDMGLGKTVQALALIQRDRERGEEKPVLVVCPTSVVNNWKREAERFTPRLSVMVHHGSDRKRGREFAAEARRHALVISSYGLLQRDMESLREVPWAGAILDEAQNIKNPETKQARNARGIPAEYRFALTGTPVENNVGDLWSIMEYLNPGLLGSRADFKRRYFVPIQAGHDPQAASRLRRIVQPFVLRRVKTDRAIITDLPEKQEMKVFCTLTREQASLYAAVVREAEGKLAGSKGIERRGVILATLSKLKQVCNHPAQFLKDNSAIPGRSGKLTRLTEMLEETIEVGDRALVFSQFAEMGAILRRHVEGVFGREVLFLHGGVPKGQRDRMIERFQSEDHESPPVFVLSLKAGGTGLNLTRAAHVFHFDRWWNPAVENQATDRAFRIGQTHNVQVHKFICAGTLEEKIDEMITSKKEIADSVVGAGEGWLTELSNAELKNIFALRHDAIGE
jgi:SNF2 family DNA or RNA helicase